MSKIGSRKLWFDQADMTDVVSFNIYYCQAPAVVGYETPRVVVPAVPGQAAYSVDLPTMVPIAEGNYNLGVAAVDSAGNISDIDVMSSFFDFTAPAKPKWRPL